MSDLAAEYSRMAFATSERFDAERVNGVLAGLKAQCRAFIEGPGQGSLEQRIDWTVEARYPHQIWEIEVPLRVDHFHNQDDLRVLVADFHDAHKQMFEISDPGSAIELVTWRARVRCQLREAGSGRLVAGAADARIEGRRQVYFADAGWVEAVVRRFEAVEGELAGPAIVESSFTTVVIDPGAIVRRTASGSLAIRV